MAIFLPFIWSQIESVIEYIRDFIEGISPTLGYITNIGQGIYLGFTSAFSQLWNAIMYFSDYIKKAIEGFAKSFYDAYKVVSEWIWSGLNWIGQGLAWIGSTLYGFGNWLYNGIVWIFNQIVTLFENLYNAIQNFFSYITSSIQEYWKNFTDVINNWWTGIFIVLRNKLKQLIQVNLTTIFAWRGAERLLTAKDGRDAIFGLLSMIGSPIVGYTVSEIIDAIVPRPSTSVFPIMPTPPVWTVKPQTITIQRVPEKPVPEIPAIPHYAQLSKEYYPEILAVVELTPQAMLTIEKEAKIDSEFSTISIPILEKTATINTALETRAIERMRKELEANITTTLETRVTSREYISLVPTISTAISTVTPTPQLIMVEALVDAIMTVRKGLRALLTATIEATPTQVQVLEIKKVAEIEAYMTGEGMSKVYVEHFDA